MCTKWDDDADLRIAELKLCRVILNRDQFFPGYTFVVAREHVTELFHLERAARAELMEEINSVASVLNAVFNPDKMNYELLGNMVAHMHWHLVPRFRVDRLWPRPIWAEPHEEVRLSPMEYAGRIELIRKGLSE